MWTAGHRVGNYEIVAKLREGGMATLFLARALTPPLRHVALKVVHPRLARDKQFQHMFLDEAKVASRIVHPNVVHVEELGRHGDTQFLVMEFVHGCSLAQLQRALLVHRRRLSPAYAARIAIHIAEALHAAHETRGDDGRSLGVIHRDVTPENILLAYSGAVKLIDFGIAKSIGRLHRTREGSLKGKFRYMAPEQANGKPIDRRVDVYQLGIVLWEMLTLRRLFNAEGDLELLEMVRAPRVAPPSSLADRIPSSLDRAVLAALHPDPRQRTPTAWDLARSIEEAVPHVNDVDATALRGLVTKAMNEHRNNERNVYPRGVYEQLDAFAEQSTALIVGALPPVPQRAHSPSQRPSERAPTRPLGPRSDRPADGFKSDRALRGRRPLKLVRYATELRTELTRLVDPNFVGSRTYWMLIGAAVGLLAAMVLIAFALGPRTRSVPSLPDTPNVQVVPSDR